MADAWTPWLTGECAVAFQRGPETAGGGTNFELPNIPELARLVGMDRTTEVAARSAVITKDIRNCMATE